MTESPRHRAASPSKTVSMNVRRRAIVPRRSAPERLSVPGSCCPPSSQGPRTASLKSAPSGMIRSNSVRPTRKSVSLTRSRRRSAPDCNRTAAARTTPRTGKIDMLQTRTRASTTKSPWRPAPAGVASRRRVRPRCIDKTLVQARPNRLSHPPPPLQVREKRCGQRPDRPASTSDVAKPKSDTAHIIGAGISVSCLRPGRS